MIDAVKRFFKADAVPTDEVVETPAQRRYYGTSYYAAIPPMERGAGWWVCELEEIMPGCQGKVVRWLRGPYPSDAAACATMPPNIRLD
jgi:hypothetical protein